MKITILTPFFPYPKRGYFYGGERYNENLAINLKNLGHEVKIVTTYWNGSKKLENYNGIKILRILDSIAINKRFGDRFFLQYISFGLNLFRRNNFKFYRDSDIIILAVAIPFSSFFLVKRLPVISIFFHYEDFYNVTFRVLHFLEKHQFKKYRIITLSNISKNDLIKYYDVKPGNIKVIPVGIDANKYNPSNYSKDIRKKYGNNILLYSGLFIRRKRIPILLKAMVYVIKEIPDVQLILTGGNTFSKGKFTLEYCKNLAKSLEIQNHTTFLGFIEDNELAKYYATSDIFITPSEQEGFGQVILEAMASGTPVICADKPPMSEIIGGGGLTFKIDDSDDLANKIIYLLKNREELKILKTNALKITENYKWSKIAKIYDNYTKKIKRIYNNN
ncbi:MAG: glycosyltransferase family 4 protein [Promethearchaeota archaeon]